MASALHDTSTTGKRTELELVAGMMMVFNKDTWEKVGGFPENRIDYDIEFSKLITKKGIMEGIYVFHDYRLPSTLEDAGFFTNHLK